MPRKAPELGTHAADLLPQPYYFALLVFPPCLIFPSLLSALLGPRSFFNSLVPFTWPLAFTPQLWSLFYMYMASMVFSGIVEPALVYTAVYKLESARDAQRVLEVIESAMGVFDVMHSIAIWMVPGREVVSDRYAGVHFWIPVGFFVVRSLWFLGFRRRIAGKDRVRKSTDLGRRQI